MNIQSKRSKNKRNKKKKNKVVNEINNKDVNTNVVQDNAEDEHETELQHDDFNQDSRKREHIEDDSDNDETPKKKKKKKKPIAEQTTDKKGKKSIRQMKREKLLQRQAEEQAASKDQLKSQCHSYLSQWKHDKQNWKFMKAKQVWLYKNKFSSTLLPDALWPVLLEYFESAKGNIRNMLLEDAHKIIKKMDEWTESQNEKKDKNEEDAEDSDTAQESSKPDSTSYKRARDIIQCLEE